MYPPIRMAESLEAIAQYFKLSEVIATAGQPTEAQFVAIAEAGYQIVINLALPTSPQALPHEPDLVAQLGMDYLAIPVEWEHPSVADVQQFFAVMQAHCDRRVFVHCAANKRVSVFMYLYRVLVQNVEPTLALTDLHRIWTPNPTWQNLIDMVLQQG